MIDFATAGYDECDLCNTALTAFRMDYRCCVTSLNEPHNRWIENPTRCNRRCRHNIYLFLFVFMKSFISETIAITITTVTLHPITWRLHSPCCTLLYKNMCRLIDYIIDDLSAGYEEYQLVRHFHGNICNMGTTFPIMHSGTQAVVSVWVLPQVLENQREIATPSPTPSDRDSSEDKQLASPQHFSGNLSRSR